jgi:hypothetical protein
MFLTSPCGKPKECLIVLFVFGTPYSTKCAFVYDRKRTLAVLPTTWLGIMIVNVKALPRVAK